MLSIPRPRYARAWSVLLALAALLILLPGAANPTELEDWQLQGGPFVTAADVRAHNQLGNDLAAIRAALAEDEPDYQTALRIYTFGLHFPWRDRTHSLGRFADDYNETFRAFFPEAVSLFGGTTFLQERMFSALAGTGAFQGASDVRRIAAVEAGMLAIVNYWSQFELAMAHRKVGLENWSLQNGVPKNWNEIFAFYYGPDGEHSLYQAVMAASERFGIDERLPAMLFEALAAGQEIILGENWPTEAAAAVRDALLRSGMLLFLEALHDLDEALLLGEAAEPVVEHLRGHFQVIGPHLAVADPAAARQAQALLAAPPSAGTVGGLRRSVLNALTVLGWQVGEFGSALR